MPYRTGVARWGPGPAKPCYCYAAESKNPMQQESCVPMFKVNKKNIYILLIAIVALLLYAYGSTLTTKIEQLRSFDLSEVNLTTRANLQYAIQKEQGGYLIFYARIIDCVGCVRDLGVLKELSEAYKDIAFYAIVNGKQHRHTFFEFADFYELPGEHLVDSEGRIQNRLGLSEHPSLLFFNSDQRLMAIMPMDLDHNSLVVQLHRYLGAM